MKRVTPKSTRERQNKTTGGDFPKLKDIIVNLSVREVPKVTRKLRLIGTACEYAEIQPYTAVWSLDKKTGKKKRDWVKTPFPDAALNAAPTRIGHDEEDKCPWRAAGFRVNRRFVQRCLEEQEDGTWVHKILVKGPLVFDKFTDWEEGQREELADNPDQPISTFLGGRSAPAVKVVAKFDDTKMGDVDYTVHVGPKDMVLTEEHINLLRAVHEPTADELNAFRAEYNMARDEDPDMPEFEDFFEYGHDVRKIFKYTPPKNQAPDEEEEQDETEEEEESSETTPDSSDDASEALTEEDEIDLGEW